MSEDEGLVSACLLDGAGGGRRLDWSGVEQWSPDDGLLWVHLDYTAPRVQAWFRHHSGVDEIVSEAILAEETRPRSTALGNGLLLTLRGVNLNPGADPEDMVSIRVWTDGRRIISTRKRRLLSVDDLRRDLDRGKGPATVGQFIVQLADHLIERMADVVGGIDETVDGLEDQVLTMQSYQLRGEIAGVRREIISLRRYLAPQREAMARLHSERMPWFEDVDRMRLRETADRITRYIEDLDSARDRAGVTHEELMGRLSEQLDRRMYVLAIVTTVFLPLGFLTGLLGINVGGIPGANDKHGFVVVIAGLIGLVLAQLWLLKRRKWF